MTQPTFNLRTAVNDILDTTDLTDLGEIASKVDEQVPDELIRPLFRTLLRGYVRETMNWRRMSPGTPAALPPVAGTTPTVSSKVDAIRAAAPTWLHERIYVGAGQRKLLSDCGIADLQYWEGELQRIADRATATQRRPRQLRALLVEYRVDRVGDLPPAVLAGFVWAHP